MSRRQSVWDRRDHFVFQHLRRHLPHSLHPAILEADFLCLLAAQDVITEARCRAYSSTGATTCMFCASVCRLFADRVKEGSPALDRIPLLRIMRGETRPKPQPAAGHPSTRPAPLPVQIDRAVVETATPKIETAPVTPPDPPAKYKYLYVGKCSECKTPRQKIVAWDLCWRCFWTWKNRRP